MARKPAPGLHEAVIKVFESSDTPLTSRGVADRIDGDFEASQVAYAVHVLSEKGLLAAAGTQGRSRLWKLKGNNATASKPEPTKKPRREILGDACHKAPVSESIADGLPDSAPTAQDVIATVGSAFAALVAIYPFAAERNRLCSWIKAVDGTLEIVRDELAA